MFDLILALGGAILAGIGSIFVVVHIVNRIETRDALRESLVVHIPTLALITAAGTFLVLMF